MHNARHIANYFINRACEEGTPFTHLQIQKLVYYSHVWMLIFFDSSMIYEDIEVWRYGPVIPEIFHCLHYNRGDPVTEIIPIHPNDNIPFTEHQRNILEAVWDRYSEKTGIELSTLASQKGTPWYKANSKKLRYIPEKYIIDYYSKLLPK